MNLDEDYKILDQVQRAIFNAGWRARHGTRRMITTVDADHWKDLFGQLGGGSLTDEPVPNQALSILAEMLVWQSQPKTTPEADKELGEKWTAFANGPLRDLVKKYQQSQAN